MNENSALRIGSFRGRLQLNSSNVRSSVNGQRLGQLRAALIDGSSLNDVLNLDKISTRKITWRRNESATVEYLFNTIKLICSLQIAVSILPPISIETIKPVHQRTSQGNVEQRNADLMIPRRLDDILALHLTDVKLWVTRRHYEALQQWSP